MSSSIKNNSYNCKNILIVDDANDTRLLLSYMVKLLGGTPYLCSNGHEALHKTKATDIDLVFMDLQMPIVDGYESLKLLRLSGFNKPVVALTAHAFEKEKLLCFESGFDDFISKPFSKDDLIKTASKFFGDDKRKPSSSQEEEEEEACCDLPSEALRLFHKNFKEALGQIDRAVNSGDTKTLLLISHKLKGSSSCFEFRGLSDSADLLNKEISAHGELTNDALFYIQQLTSQYNKLS